MRNLINTYFADATPLLITVFLGGAAFFLFCASIFSYSVFHPSESLSSMFTFVRGIGSANTVQADTIIQKVPGAPAILGINVANNGLVYLKNATVTAVLGTNITVNISWGSADFPWDIQTSNATRFLKKDGTLSATSNIHVGDRLIVSGMLDVGAAEPTVVAKSVRVSWAANPS